VYTTMTQLFDAWEQQLNESHLLAEVRERWPNNPVIPAPSMNSVALAFYLRRALNNDKDASTDPAELGPMMRNVDAIIADADRLLGLFTTQPIKTDAEMRETSLLMLMASMTSTNQGPMPDPSAEARIAARRSLATSPARIEALRRTHIPTRPTAYGLIPTLTYVDHMLKAWRATAEDFKRFVKANVAVPQEA
jgi:hypothetical protein